MSDPIGTSKLVELTEVTADEKSFAPNNVSAHIAVESDDDEVDAEEALVDTPFFWHHAKTSRDFQHWEEYNSSIQELQSMGTSSDSVEELHIAGAPSFPETDEESFEEVNFENLRKEYLTNGVEFTDEKHAELNEWYAKYNSAIEKLDGEDKARAKKLMEFSGTMIFWHLDSQTPLLHILLDKFLPSFMSGCVQKCSSWKPRIAQKADSSGQQKSITGQRDMLDLLKMHLFMMLVVLIGFAFPIFSSLGVRLAESPLLTAQNCSYMAPSIAASSFPSQSDFLMNRSSWSIDMFATIGLVNGFKPNGDYFASEYKAAGAALPPVDTCVLSTPVSIKVDPSAPYDLIQSGTYQMRGMVPLVFNTSKSSADNVCVGYNDMEIGAMYSETTRGLADLIVLTVTYVLSLSILGRKAWTSRNMAVALQNRSILVDTRTTLHKYLNTYRWLIIALVYLIFLWKFTSVWEVWVFVPYGSKAQFANSTNPCSNFNNGGNLNYYCGTCSGLKKPVFVYYDKKYTEGISAAFNQSFVIAIALFQMCTLLLAKYNFMDGDQYVSPNERHSAYRNLHKLRQRFITWAQIADYLNALHERRLDWCIKQPGFEPVLKQVGDADQQKPPRKTPETKLRYYYTLKEAREISKKKDSDYPNIQEDWWTTFKNYLC